MLLTSTDTSALAHAADAMHDLLVGRAVGRMPSRADAEDVVQDAYARVLQSGNLPEDARSAAAYMQTALTSAIADWYRRRRPDEPQPDVGHDVADGRDDVDVHAPSHDVEQQAERLLACAMTALPADQAAAIKLVDIEGETQSQAAIEAGISVPGMKSRVQRGRAAIHEAMLSCCRMQFDDGVPIRHTGHDGTDECSCGC